MHHFGKSHFRHYSRTLQLRTHINTATAAAALRPFCLRMSCLVSLRFYLASWVSPQRQGKVTGTVCRSPPPGGGVGKGGRGRAVASPIWGARRPAQPDACLQQPAALLSVLASIALGAHCSGPSDGSGTAARLAPKLVRLSAPLLLPQHQQLTTTTLWFAAAAEIIPIDLRSNLAILIFPARAAPMLEDAEDYYAATATTSAGMGTVFVTH
jgi:hypothetical protein